MSLEKAFNSELEKRRCRCCVSERQARAAVWILFGCTLLAYTAYTVVQTVESRTHPATTRQVLATDVVYSPGLMLCPFDSMTEPRPMHFLQLTNSSGVCVRAPQGLRCEYRYREFHFATVDTDPRICLDIPPGIPLQTTRDLVAVTYIVRQVLNAERQGTPYNGLYYGFYSADDDASRNATVINLANAGGKTVITFTATQYVPLQGDERVGFEVGQVASAGLLADGIVDVNETDTEGAFVRYFQGTVYLATQQMNIIKTSEIWGFDWSQAIGAIGGIYSLLKGWVVMVQGEAKDPEGLLKRYFYATPKTAAGPAAATAGASTDDGKAAGSAVAAAAAADDLRQRNASAAANA